MRQPNELSHAHEISIPVPDIKIGGNDEGWHDDIEEGLVEKILL